MKYGIYKGDCLDLIPSLPDNSIDLCLTDPPYGIAYQSAWRTDKQSWKPKILNDESPFTEWLNPLFPKMKEGGRLVCFYRWDVQNEFIEAIQSAGFTIKSQLVWDKVVHGMGDLKGEFAPMHELMIYATKGRFEFQHTRPKTIYRQTRVSAETMVHPNQKPLPLMAAIIRDLTLKGDTVLDPFGGSFVTYRAAIQEDRNGISFELSDFYYDKGLNLTNKGISLSLF